MKNTEKVAYKSHKLTNMSETEVLVLLNFKYTSTNNCSFT